ncbi:1,4-dihydroxy-2-naphthoate octaprenyltransferase [Terasakiella sp. SH-1]|uniref:1,4-dihydroxy-2-naphthoate octaprenyltransferase n=1 Tax=Terasakiella sp. SH-1 TaxID=2560057 RepID=UPI0010739549|nr:1,4-dihydroxy-2-naphthoate octaprenyltransferase [Terasakiella sp. SH-1]
MTFPSWRVLWLGIRPKTLSLSFMPVLCAYMFAHHEAFDVSNLNFALILMAALSIQMATNLFNDAHDFLNGTDQTSRIGPTRITQSGLASAQQTKNAAIFFMGLATLCGGALLYSGGWIVALLGTLALICAYSYSAGPWPIARSPFGEVFVLGFFGLAAFSVSFFLITGQWATNGLLYGIAIGLPACAILLLNNYRDLENDVQAGRRTLAICLGDQGTKILFPLLVITPYPILGYIAPSPFFLAGLPLSLLVIFKFLNITDKRQLNPALGLCALSQIVMCLGLIIGFIQA